VLVEGAVVPAARGRGFGRRLLAWAEERAAVLHRERHPDAPGAVLVAVHERNPSKHALVRAAGYEPVHWEYLMTRGVDEPLLKVASTPPGLTVAPYARARDEVVRQAHREAFADHWGTTPPDPVRWSQWFTGARAFRPEVSWLALGGDEVAGYLLTYFFAAEAAATGVREAYVGQLGVRSAWRRRGIVGHGARVLRGQGYDRAALTVDTHSPTGALGLYKRAGFVAKDRWAVWSKPLA
jgi:GNAT superfamily N-acetyltransferase